MNFGSTGGDAPGRAPEPSAPARTGIPGRVESALKTHVPAPKGRGIVMLLLGVAVIGALIWDFSGRGAARRAVQRQVDDGQRPVPKEAPPGAGPARAESPLATPPGADADLRLPLQTAEGPRLELTPGSAAGLLASAPPDERAGMRRQLLEALVAPCEGRGVRRRQAFEAAAWFVEAGDPPEVVAPLTLAALPALADHEAAAAAILFLGRLRDRGGPLAASALDKVILDARRPLDVRLAAARIRPAAGRPDALRELVELASTHPLLREALAGE